VSRPAKRKSKPAHVRSGREPRPGGTPSPTPVFATALRTARGIHLSREPLEVEALASSLLGMFDQPLIDVDDPVDFPGESSMPRTSDTRRSAG
jgi:hypothetical protein